MSEKKNTLVKAAIAVGVLFVVWLILTRKGGSTITDVTNIIQGDTNPFEYPYTTTTPGIPDSRPGPIFNNGDTNVNVGTIGANGLSNQYMPVFGLVGMTAVQG